VNGESAARCCIWAWRWAGGLATDKSQRLRVVQKSFDADEDGGPCREVYAELVRSDWITALPASVACATKWIISPESPNVRCTLGWRALVPEITRGVFKKTRRYGLAGTRIVLSGPKTHRVPHSAPEPSQLDKGRRLPLHGLRNYR